jgi:serine/threonine-protein kinase
VDPAFEEVLAQALAQDRQKRFQSAREFGDGLASYLFSHKLKVTSYDIAAMIKKVLSERGKSQRPREQSIIDRLIQEELLRFTSLDDMSDPLNPGAVPLSPEDVAGAAPLDAAVFENPADWFSDDEEVAAALGGHEDRVSGPPPQWHEAGLGNDEDELLGNLASLEGTSVYDIDQEALQGLSSAPEAPDADEGVHALQQPAARVATHANETPSVIDEPVTAPRAPALPAGEPAQVQPRSRAGVLIALAVLALVCAGVAAYFGGLLPQ